MLKIKYKTLRMYTVVLKEYFINNKAVKKSYGLGFIFVEKCWGKRKKKVEVFFLKIKKTSLFSIEIVGQIFEIGVYKYVIIIIIL